MRFWGGGFGFFTGLLASSIALGNTAIPLTVVLSEAVTVTGTPRIAVDVGGQTRYATYSSGSGTNSLTFTLSPQAGDVDLDGIAVSSPIDLNGGSLKDAIGNDAVLTFTAPITSGIKVNYPSLGMDFVYDSDGRYTLNGTAYNDLTSFLSAVGGTFTRASIGSYYDNTGALQTAVSGAPRFDWDPLTLVAKGILIEEGRTNLVLRSAEMDNATWSKTSSTVTANTTVAPDGSMSAEKIIETATGPTSHFVTQTIATSSGSTYTFSVYLKKAERSWALIDADTSGSPGYVYVDLTNGVFGTQVGTLTSKTIQALSNGWYRVSITYVASAATMRPAVLLMTNSSTWAYTGDGVSGLYLWGAQFELGAFPTSYIPTTSATVARSADVLKIPTGTWYNSTYGTMYVQVYDARSAGLGIWASLGSVGSIADRCQMYSSAGSMLMQNYVGGVAQVLATGGSRNYGLNKVAYALQSNNFAYVSNGGSIGTNTTGSLGAKTVLTIGRGADYGSDIINDHVLQFKYYPARVANAQLLLLTQ